MQVKFFKTLFFTSSIFIYLFRKIDHGNKRLNKINTNLIQIHFGTLKIKQSGNNIQMAEADKSSSLKF